MCCLFFCKQKTAYEMRISDWSSDVCSSDLVPDAADRHPRILDPPVAERPRERSGGRKVRRAIGRRGEADRGQRQRRAGGGIGADQRVARHRPAGALLMKDRKSVVEGKGVCM